MKLQFYLEKLFDSDEFKEFKKKNKDAFFCSGFFSIDKKGKDNKQHIDFFSPKTKELFNFKLEENIELLPTQNFGDEYLPEEMDEKLDFDFEEIENLIEGKMEEEKIDKKIEKILLSLQKIKGTNFLIGTVFITGLGLLKVKLDLDRKKIMDFEKKSFFDMMKIVKK